MPGVERTPFFEALEHPTFAVIEPVRSFDNNALRDWVVRRLEPECEVHSVGLGCFRRIEEARHARTTLVTGGGRATTEAKGARWVNVLLANLKRDQRLLPCDSPSQVRAAPSGRGRLSLQPPTPVARDAAAPGDRAAMLQALS